PLLLELLAATVDDAGAKVVADVAALLSAAIRALDPTSRRCLEILAVAQAPLPLATVATALGLDLGEVRSAMTALRRRRLVRTTGARGTDVCEVGHDSVRAVVLAAMNGDERGRAQRGLAAALDHSPLA